MAKKQAVTKKATVTKRTRRIDEKDLAAWLKRKIGNRTIADFAAEIGTTRECISAILNGRRELGPRSCALLGVVRIEKVYVVRE